jgi:ATP-dependent RNA helicase RhlE
VHRIGRTGRASASGIAVSFCDKEERPYLTDIEKLIKQQVPRMPEHQFMDDGGDEEVETERRPQSSNNRNRSRNANPSQNQNRTGNSNYKGGNNSRRKFGGTRQGFSGKKGS